jgi:hypothetical protein
MIRETVIIFIALKLKKAHGEGTGLNLIPDILHIKISSSNTPQITLFFLDLF